MNLSVTTNVTIHFTLFGILGVVRDPAFTSCDVQDIIVNINTCKILLLLFVVFIPGWKGPSSDNIYMAIFSKYILFIMVFKYYQASSK